MPVCRPIHATPTQQSRADNVCGHSLGDAPFYRGSVNTGNGDTALIFASDRQLELLRSCRPVYVDGLRPAYRSLATINYNTTCEVHHLAFHTCRFPRFPVVQFGAAFSSLAFSVHPTDSNVKSLQPRRTTRLRVEICR